MSAPIDSRVSPSLDPETYRSIEGVNGETIKYVGSVINAMNDAYVTVGELWDARRAADDNPGWTPEARIENVGRAAEKHKLRVLQKIDFAARDLAANIAHTEKLLGEPLTERAGRGTLNGEVRAHVKALDRSERETFMTEALERDDVPTLEAILGGQPFLSGLTQIDHEHYVRLFHTRKNPHLVVRLDVMQRFRDRLDRIGLIVHEQFEKPVGAKPKVVEALTAASDRAMAALDIKPKP